MNGKIVFCGCISSGWELLNFLLNNGIPISCIVTIDPKMAEKNTVSGYKTFDDISKKFNIPIYFAEHFSLKTKSDYNFFKEANFNLMVLGGWQRLIPEKILSTLEIGGIGVHGSSEMLPKFRGRSPLNWSLIEGRSRFIIQYFLMKSGVDDGDIFHYTSYDINYWDNIRTLYYKYTICNKRTYLEWIPKLLDGNYQLTPQVGEPSYYPKRTPSDGLIDWTKSVLEIYNFVRGQTHPYPGAFSYMDGNKIHFWEIQPFDTRIMYDNTDYGEIVDVFSEGDYVINCPNGLVLVTNSTLDEPVIGSIFKDD